MMSWRALWPALLLLAVAPLLPGVAVKARAFLTGRKGPPVLQLYYDLLKLVRKRAVYSTTTTWVFRAGPVVMLAALVAASLFLPLDGRESPVRFEGDLLAFAGLLALARFALVLAGLDTGSSFEGMGASREVAFSSFAEPGLFVCLVTLVLATGDVSMNGLFGAPLGEAWSHAAASLVMVGISLFVLLLAENSRVPVDDPATHLELTMIHEVIILDHSGADLAFILLASALKLAIFSALVAGVFVPLAGVTGPAALGVLLVGLLLVAVCVGVVESVMARLRLSRVPQLLVGSGALALFAAILLLR
jgi:formate hydrogenlyase subunit 4